MLLHAQVNDSSAKSLTVFIPVATEAMILMLRHTNYHKQGLDCMLYLRTFKENFQTLYISSSELYEGVRW